MDKSAHERHGRQTLKDREGRKVIRFIYNEYYLTINGEETAKNGDFITEFASVYEEEDNNAQHNARNFPLLFGGASFEEVEAYTNRLAGYGMDGKKLICDMDDCGAFVYLVSFRLRMKLGASFPFFKYLRYAYNQSKDGVIILSEEDAEAWRNEEIKKNFASARMEFTAQKPADEPASTDEKESEETTAKNVVSHDFYKCLERIEASETTKRIAEYVALSWGRTMREFAEANPSYNAVTKRKAWTAGKIEIPADVIEPLYFTPTQLAKEFFPHDYKKVGQQKTARRALASFVPLTKATISETITDKTGKVAERVTPIFTISTDFVEGTPAEVKRLFSDDPTKFAEDEANLKYIFGFRVFPTIPLIANQFVNVGGVDTWRKHVLAQRSEAVTMGGRRLGLLNVAEVSEAQIITPDEMPARWTKTPTEKTKGFKAVAEIACEMYGKPYQYKPRQKKFVATLTKVKPADDVPEKESKQ